jgi:hypothetical protein
VTRIGGSEASLLKLVPLIIGALGALAAMGLGILPAWAIVPFAAGGLLAWGVMEYLADRPVRASGE